MYEVHPAMIACFYKGMPPENFLKIASYYEIESESNFKLMTKIYLYFQLSYSQKTSELMLKPREYLKRS